MSDKQYHKILASFVVSIILIGVVIFLLITLINKPKDIENYYYIGAKGDSGYTPIKGVDYRDGLDSVSTVTEIQTIIEKQTVVQEKTIENVPVKGDKGDVGATGPAGNQILINVDYYTCELQTKYEGDRFWTTIAQLPSPCGITNNEN